MVYPDETLKTLRYHLTRVAFHHCGAIDRLVKFVKEQNPPQHWVNHLEQSARSGATGLLASFGIHACGGCGHADPEWYNETYGKACSCRGSGWIHEEKADPNHPGYGRHGYMSWAPKMFGPSKAKPGWHAKWKLKV